MYALLGVLLTWLFFWGATAGILVFDDRRAKAAAKRTGGVDFVERRLRAYVGAAFFFGAFVLILYFWSTRRSVKGALLGVALLVAVVVPTSVLSGALKQAALVHACTHVVPGSDGDACSPDHSNPDRLRLLEAGCLAGGVSPCLWRGDDLFMPPDTPESEWRGRARAICSARPTSVPRGRCEVFDLP